MARYVFMRSDLTLESIERQMERELSPAFCRSLLARIGVHELPRAEFPADAVLRGFLSADVLTDLQSRVALHALAAPWVLPTDSVADMAAARHAWEVVSWSPFPVAEPGFWSLSGTQPTLEKDAIALQMDSLQIESLQKRGRDFSAQLVGDGLRELRRLRASVGDTASVRLLRAPTEGDLEIFHALSARSLLAALPATLERADVPLSVRWGLLSTGYALARCGAAGDTGVEDAPAWLRAEAPKIGLWERAVVERIRRWPRNGWHCGGLADRRAVGWRRTPERPPIYVAWESRTAT